MHLSITINDDLRSFKCCAHMHSFLCLTGPFSQNCCRLCYCWLGRSIKVNFCELLWQNIYRPDAFSVTQQQHQSTEG